MPSVTREVTMASRPNMAKFNAAVRKLKSSSNQFDRDMRSAQTELNRIARRSRSSSTTTYRLSPSDQALLRTVREQVAADPVQREHDVFLSHAGPDLSTAQQLYASLVEHGAEVWMDDFSIKLGQNIIREIDLGIASSQVGVVLVTPAVLAGRYWVEQEFTALLNSKAKVIPVLHEVTWTELANYSPILTVKKGLSTEEHTIEEIAEMIVSTLFVDDAGS
jgi:hypothetical protein